MQQIADWLEKLGLGQYAQRFAENEIDISMLPILAIRTSRTSAFRWGIGGDYSRPLLSLLALPVQLLNLLCKRNRKPKTPPSAAKSR